MQIYNSLSKKKEVFSPINPPFVTFYVCGPTVYNYFHIGNARSFIMSDIIRRYLDFMGYKVKYVMNLTDIDDKIIKKAKDEGKSTIEVANFYINAFLEDLQKLRVRNAELNPRATEHVADIIQLIKELEHKDFAYNIDGNVFFDITKFKEYGKLSGKNLEELEIGARIEVNETKKNPLDFSLWKKAKDDEPYWDSPWGKGRPGWHIECSAMSCKHLGKTIDIHAGGNDLIFPHHENEIAQSEAANDQQFVKYWIHFGFLNFQGEKMSKSLGNFYTAREVVSRYSPEAIRLFFSQTHYRGPLSYSEELLTAAEKGVEKIKNLQEKIESEILKNTTNGINPSFDIDTYFNEFKTAMDDDFNTPRATAVIFDFLKNVNKLISENPNINVEFYLNIKDYLAKTADDVLGIIDFRNMQSHEIDKEIEDKLIELLISIRTQMKQEKNFAMADLIREELSKLGILLKDTKEGSTYKKV